MFILGLGTATPSKCYTQAQCWDALQRSPHFAQLRSRSQALCRKIFGGANGIESRFLALDRLEDGYDLSPSTLHRRFESFAPALGTTAARRALAESGVDPGQIDALLVSTCTGYLCPGLTSYLSERLGLRPETLLLDLVGQGCGAALPNLRTAESLLAAGRCRRVLSVCVEICSAALFLDDDPGVLVSACLFGDGAGAAVLASEPQPGRRQVRWVNAWSILSAVDRDCLRFETCEGRLRNILAPEVPRLAADHAAKVFTLARKECGLRPDDIDAWILHAGGRDVLSALRQQLGLAESDTKWSAEILRQHGNLSSPFVLFVLDAALRNGLPPGKWWMASFGAGFSSHGALLEVT